MSAGLRVILQGKSLMNKKLFFALCFITIASVQQSTLHAAHTADSSGNFSNSAQTEIGTTLAAYDDIRKELENIRAEFENAKKIADEKDKLLEQSQKKYEEALQLSKEVTATNTQVSNQLIYSQQALIRLQSKFTALGVITIVSLVGANTLFSFSLGHMYAKDENVQTATPECLPKAQAANGAAKVMMPKEQVARSKPNH
jgi:hypothetical protein